MNTADYHRKITTLLSDNIIYEARRGTPQTTLRRKSQITFKTRYKTKLLTAISTTDFTLGMPHHSSIDFPRYTRRESHSDPLSAASTQSPRTLPNISLVGNTLHNIQNSTDFFKKIQHLKLLPSETIVSFDVTSLFTCNLTVDPLCL